MIFNDKIGISVSLLLLNKVFLESDYVSEKVIKFWS